MAKGEMRIVEVTLKTWAISIRVGEPYTPQDSGKYRGNKTPKAITEQQGHLTMLNTDGTVTRYVFSPARIVMEPVPEEPEK